MQTNYAKIVCMPTSRDPLATLAHPLRARLHGLLRVGGPSTASRMAAALGTHSGATSYHLRILAKAPGRVRKIVGITPVGASPTPFDEAGRDLFWGAVEDPGKRFGIIDFTTGNRNSATWVQSVVDHSLTNSTTEGFLGALEAWAGPDFLDEIAGSETPMLVIPGEHDPALGEATVRQTWEPHFPNCQIHVMANAGHYPMFETPVQLATVIERFLAD